MVEINLKDSITILGLRTVLRNKIDAHMQNPAILFEWRNSSGCDFLHQMAEINLQDSITILGWRTVLRNQIVARMQTSCYFVSMERFQWL